MLISDVMSSVSCVSSEQHYKITSPGDVKEEGEK